MYWLLNCIIDWRIDAPVPVASHPPRPLPTSPPRSQYAINTGGRADGRPPLSASFHFDLNAPCRGCGGRRCRQQPTRFDLPPSPLLPTPLCAMAFSITHKHVWIVSIIRAQRCVRTNWLELLCIYSLEYGTPKWGPLSHARTPPVMWDKCSALVFGSHGITIWTRKTNKLAIGWRADRE